MPKKIIKSLPKKHSVFFTIGLRKSKAYFLENVSMLIESGLTIEESLETIKEEINVPNMKVLVGDIIEYLRNGDPFWKALAKTGIFSAYVIALTRVGEESGTLSQNLAIIAEQQKKDTELKTKITSAMMYPGLVFAITFLITIGIVQFILPNLINVFNQLDLTLPWTTRILVVVGNFMGQYGYIATPSLLIFLFLLFFILFLNPQTKYIGKGLLLHLPITGKLISETEVARFGYTFGTLLEAGVPIVDALESLVRSTDTRVFKRLYYFMWKKIAEGNSFEKVFSSYHNSEKILPVYAQQMVKSGEMSGKLPQVLMRISSVYETRLDNTTKNLATMMEPILLIIVWLGVAFIALSIIMPIYGLVGGIK